MNVEILEFYDPPKKVSEFTSEPYGTKYTSNQGSYFALCKFTNGNVLISENKTIGTMGLAQNWIAFEANVRYESNTKIQSVE